MVFAVRRSTGLPHSLQVEVGEDSFEVRVVALCDAAQEPPRLPAAPAHQGRAPSDRAAARARALPPDRLTDVS